MNLENWVPGRLDQYSKKDIYEKNLDEYHKKYPEDEAKKLLKLKLKEFLKELDQPTTNF